MIYKEFGSTGAKVSVVGQGTWMIESDRRGAVEALRAGLGAGMTHIDPAEMYGNGRSEQIVGEAIAGRREEVFLASKVLPSNASYDGTLRACERSLENLGTDWLDLYMLHWPGSHPISDTMRALEKLVEEKTVRFIGVSNFDLRELKAAEAALRNEKLSFNQVLYHLGDRGIERKLLPYCGQRGIAIVAYSPYGHGDFPSAKSREGRVLAEIAERHGKTPRQVVLNFLTRFPHVFTIPKTVYARRAQENAGGAGWDLTPEDLAAIDKAFPAPDHDVPLGIL
jgi:diketogulonate reductase-like aldo/keto reductase